MNFGSDLAHVVVGVASACSAQHWLGGWVEQFSPVFQVFHLGKLRFAS